MSVIRFRKAARGKITVSGLTEADARLIAHMLDRASFSADSGGPRSEAVLRLSRSFLVIANHSSSIGNHDVLGGSTPIEALYEEPINLAG